MHVYVHVPFCRRRCSYCDFAIAVRRVVPVTAFVDTIRQELDLRFGDGDLVPAPVSTLYLGGGTPSLLGSGVADLVGEVRSRFGLAEGCEVTLEVNPEDVDPSAAAGWMDSGVNRFSVGVQSFQDEVLAWMHRSHGGAGARAALQTLAAVGARNVSADLIFARPDGLAGSVDADLDELLRCDLQHVSAYGLTREPRTPYARWVERGQSREADPDRYAEEFLRVRKRLTQGGFEHYEVSNYGRPGHRSRHNSAYWTGAEYVGLGPSAHSHGEGRRRWNVRNWRAYRDAVATGTDPCEGSEDLDPGQRFAERMYLGLRCAAGMSRSEIPSELDSAIGDLVASGWAVSSQGRIVLTADGWLRLDAIIERLLTTIARGG